MRTMERRGEMPKLPEKIDDWQAPWEKSGDEFNAETAKKFIFDLHKDVEKKADELKVAKTDKKTAEDAREELQTQLDAKTTGKDDEAATLSRENARLQAQLDKIAKAEADRKSLALDVALDIDGITAKQAKALSKRLSGTTKEELEEDAQATIEELGLHIGPPKDAEEDEFDQGGIQKRGERLRTSGDPKPTETTLPAADLEAVNKLFPM